MMENKLIPSHRGRDATTERVGLRTQRGSRSVVSGSVGAGEYVDRAGQAAQTRGVTSRFAQLAELDESDPDDIGIDTESEVQQVATSCVEPDRGHDWREGRRQQRQAAWKRTRWPPRARWLSRPGADLAFSLLLFFCCACGCLFLAPV
ncbi:hypothetical protein Dimus_038823 [Dionaea muscipula]